MGCCPWPWSVQTPTVSSPIPSLEKGAVKEKRRNKNIYVCMYVPLGEEYCPSHRLKQDLSQAMIFHLCNLKFFFPAGFFCLFFFSFFSLEQSPFGASAVHWRRRDLSSSTSFSYLPLDLSISAHLVFQFGRRVRGAFLPTFPLIEWIEMEVSLRLTSQPCLICDWDEKRRRNKSFCFSRRI